MVNIIPPDHMDDVPIVEPNQYDDVPVVPKHVLVDEDEDPKEDEFKEEEDPQEEKDDIVSLEKSNKNVNGLHPTSQSQFSICNRLNGVIGLS
nr:hypothetical protein [Tanacetum cinerariifolium]